MNEIFQKLGSIEAVVRDTKETVSELKTEMREGFNDDRKRLRVLEDWKLSIVLLSAVVGTAASTVYNYFLVRK